MQTYWIPAGEARFSEEIKKSRFITFLAPTAGVEAAKAYIQQVREQFPDAGHHCWAFVAGAPDDSQRLGFSDDGEPSGTAGKPMLAQLMGSGIGEVTAVSVRYYGGIPLGTGGLVKAYGGGVQQALKQLARQEKVLCTAYRLQCDYKLHDQIAALIGQAGGEVNACEFGADVTLQVAIPDRAYESVARRLRDISRGTLQISAIS